MIKAFLIAFTILTSHAASWYASTASSGAANGTSWANAWATNNIVWGGAGVIAGDTLYLDGGSTGKVYTVAFNVGVNGSSAGNRVTISVGQDANHNGPVIFDCQNDPSHLFSPSTGMFVNGASYSTITGLVGTNRYLWVINVNTDDVTRDNGIACFAGIPHDQIWEGITISNANNGFIWNASSATNIVVRYNTLRYLRGDYGFSFKGYSTGSTTNGVFHDNSLVLNADFSGTRGGPDGLAGGGGATFHDNEVTWTNGTVVLGQHPDGVQMLGNYNKVYNNRFHNPLNSGVKFEPLTPSVTYWTENYAYNNVVDVNDAMYASSVTFNGKGFELGSASSMSSVTNIVICNNTVVDLLGLTVNGGNGTWPTVPGQFLIENNAGYNCGKNVSPYGWAVGNSNLVFDFNGSVAGATGKTPIAMDLPGNGTFTSYTQTNTPAAFSFLGYVAYAPTNNFNLTANVSGRSLASIFTTDINGNTRSNWTIGAFEFTGCNYSLDSTNSVANAAGTIITGSSTINITAGVGCTWTAVANDAWITVTSGASGSGNGSTTYTVAVNSGTARSGTLTVAGTTFTVNQQGVVSNPLTIKGYTRIKGYTILK